MVRVPCRSQKQGVLTDFLRKNPPFSADFRFARVRKTAKSKKLTFRYGDLVRLTRNAALLPRFTLTFSVISGIQDRQTGNFSEKQRSEICNSG